MSVAPRPPVRTIALATVLALIAAIATYVVLDGGDDGGPSTVDTIALSPSDDVPDDPADATFTTWDDEVVALSSLRGTPLLVNFFASTCAPCITEMPALEAVHQELGDEITFLGLAVADRPDDAQRLVERTGITYRTGQDRDGVVISALGGTLLPTTVLLDADLRIVSVHTGAIDADELQQLLADELDIGS